MAVQQTRLPRNGLNLPPGPQHLLNSSSLGSSTGTSWHPYIQLEYSLPPKCLPPTPCSLRPREDTAIYLPGCPVQKWHPEVTSPFTPAFPSWGSHLLVFSFSPAVLILALIISFEGNSILTGLPAPVSTSCNCILRLPAKWATIKVFIHCFLPRKVLITGIFFFFLWGEGCRDNY